jgi:hypothetical protein
MSIYLNAVRQVINARNAIRQSITEAHPDLVWLLETPACVRCSAFLVENSQIRETDDDNGEVRYRGLRLLFVLAVLQVPDEYDRRELFALQGTRGVDSSGRPRRERRRNAACARRKPLRDIPWYVEKYLPAAQELLATHLHALVEHPALLEDALRCNGATAMVRYL